VYGEIHYKVSDTFLLSVKFIISTKFQQQEISTIRSYC